MNFNWPKIIAIMGRINPTVTITVEKSGRLALEMVWKFSNHKDAGYRHVSSILPNAPTSIIKQRIDFMILNVALNWEGFKPRSYCETASQILFVFKIALYQAICGLNVEWNEETAIILTLEDALKTFEDLKNG